MAPPRLLIASPKRASDLGLSAKAVMVSFAVAGGGPEVWPVATIAATSEALRRAGLVPDQVGRFEVHESSAAAVLAWMAGTGVPPERVNPDGGALATTAPLGAAGAGLFAAAVAGLASGEARTPWFVVRVKAVWRRHACSRAWTVHSCGQHWGVSQCCNSAYISSPVSVPASKASSNICVWSHAPVSVFEMGTRTSSFGAGKRQGHDVSGGSTPGASAKPSGRLTSTSTRSPLRC